jgi:hypothetical protein
MAVLFCTAAATADAQPARTPPTLSAELAAGVDSNPAQAVDGAALGFARLGLGARWQVTDDLGVAAEAWRRDYAGANDSAAAGLRIDWLAVPDAAPAGPLALSAEAGLYRDQLVPADARNELALAGRWVPLVTARTEIAAAAELRRQYYLNRSPPWSGRPGSASGADIRRAESDAVAVRSRSARGAAGQTAALDHQAGPGSAAASQVATAPQPRRRVDGIATIALDAAWYVSPLLSGLVTLSLARRASTVPVESCDSLAADLLLSRAGAAGWTLDVAFGWYRTDYEQAPRDLHRRDEGRSIALALRRPLGRAELSCSLSWLDNRSTLAFKSFDQTVTWCGLAWR